MTQYAKFIDENTVRFAPRKYQTPYLISFHFNENVELMKQEGFYPIVEVNKPEDVVDETHYARPTYRLVEDKQTETKVTPATLVNETTGEGYEDTVSEDVVIDNSYIECTYVAEEIVEELQEEAPEVEAPEIEGEG